MKTDLLRQVLTEAVSFAATFSGNQGMRQAKFPIAHSQVHLKVGTSNPDIDEDDFTEADSKAGNKGNKPPRRITGRNPINQKGSLLHQLLKKLQMVEADDFTDDSQLIQSRNKAEKCALCDEMHADDVPCPEKKLLDELGDKGTRTQRGMHKTGHRHNIGKLGNYPAVALATSGTTDTLRNNAWAPKSGRRLITGPKGKLPEGLGESNKKGPKGPKWNGNTLTVKTTQADMNRKSAAVVGMPPPKQIIQSKLDKLGRRPKHKKSTTDFWENDADEFQAKNDALVGMTGITEKRK